MLRTSASAVCLVLCCAAGSALAQSTIATWNFNSQQFSATTGSGTMSLIGGTTFTWNTGSPNDAGVPNNAPNTTGYPAQGAGSGTAGVEFVFSTQGFEDVRFVFDQRHSNTSSRFVRIDYSTDGGQTFVEGPVYSTPGGDTWNFDRTLDLADVPDADNKADLRVRVVSVFDPALVDAYSASRTTSTYAGTGTLRPDNVRVTGTAIVSIPPQVSGVLTPSAVCRGDASTLSVSASGGQNPPSQSLTVTADLTALGGGAAEPLVDQGGGVYTLSIPVSASAQTGFVPVPVTITDDLLRTSTTPFTLAVGDCATSSDAPVVISMVYGGGGNAGAIFSADFVELYNRSCAPVNLDGWSLQYTAAGGVNTFDGTRQVNLSGVMPAGGYLLIQTERAAPDAPGLPIPTPDLLAFPTNAEDPPVPPQSVNGFGMSNSAGRLALVAGTDPIGANCAAGAVVDLVGYGLTAFCYEGVASTANTSNTLAAIRKNLGCTDSGQNFHDFDVVFPRDPFNAASPVNPCTSGPCSPVCPPGCNPSDLTESGGTLEEPGCPDGQLTLDDILLFIDAYNDGAGCPGTPGTPCNLADLTESGGTLEEPGTPDGQLTLDDILLFVDAYNDATGC